MGSADAQTLDQLLRLPKLSTSAGFMFDIALDLRYLGCAIIVAEYGSFRRAADVMGLSQSTLSRRIQLLEHRLTMPLFERDRTGARPTAAGERFLREAAIGAAQLQQAVNEMLSARRGHTGKLRVGLMASLATGFLAELFDAFNLQFPDVELDLDESPADQITAGVSGGRLDVAFILGLPRLPGCRVETLWEEHVYLVIKEGHRLNDIEDIDWHHLRDEKFLVTADAIGAEVERYLMLKLSEPGFRPRVSVQRVGRDTLLNMVGRGYGVTLVTSPAEEVSYSAVRFRRIGKSPDRVGSSIIWRAENSNPALKKLIDLVKAQRASSTDQRDMV